MNDIKEIVKQPPPKKVDKLKGYAKSGDITLMYTLPPEAMRGKKAACDTLVEVMAGLMEFATYDLQLALDIIAQSNAILGNLNVLMQQLAQEEAAAQAQPIAQPPTQARVIDGGE